MATFHDLTLRVELVTAKLVSVCKRTPSEVTPEIWLASVRDGFAVYETERTLRLAVPDDLRLLFQSLRGGLYCAKGVCGWDFRFFGPHDHGGPGPYSEDDPELARTARDNIARRGIWEEIAFARDHHSIWCCVDSDRSEFGSVCRDNIARRGIWEEIAFARDHHSIWCCVDSDRSEFGSVCVNPNDEDYFSDGIYLAPDFESPLSWLEGLVQGRPG